MELTSDNGAVLSKSLVVGACGWMQPWQGHRSRLQVDRLCSPAGAILLAIPGKYTHAFQVIQPKAFVYNEIKALGVSFFFQMSKEKKACPLREVNKHNVSSELQKKSSGNVGMGWRGVCSVPTTLGVKLPGSGCPPVGSLCRVGHAVIKNIIPVVGVGQGDPRLQQLPTMLACTLVHVLQLATHTQSQL